MKRLCLTLPHPVAQLNRTRHTFHVHHHKLGTVVEADEEGRAVSLAMRVSSHHTPVLKESATNCGCAYCGYFIGGDDKLADTVVLCEVPADAHEMEGQRQHGGEPAG